MTESVDRQTAVLRLRGADDILILCHKNPDGDTIGCAGALYLALKALGKNAAILCSDTIPKMYDYMELRWFDGSFNPAFVVAVDVASIQLFGENNNVPQYAAHTNLCIDHHASNSGYAYETLLDPGAAAACEFLLDVIVDMGVTITPQIANCLYTGIATDTGCFKHPSVTVDTHRIAQQLLLAGAQMQKIHRMYDSMTKGKAALTAYALEHLRYELDGRCALVVLPRDVINLHQVTDDQLEGISSLPRQIEGVLVGVTLRQYKNCKGYKLSVRTDGIIDASAICARLGGGGHRGAAGCNVEDTPVEQVYQQILHSVQQQLDAQG